MKLLLFSLFPAFLFAQANDMYRAMPDFVTGHAENAQPATVHLQATPESAAAMKTLGIKGIAKTSIFACLPASSPHSVTVAPEQVYMAFPDLWPMDPELVSSTVLAAHNGNKLVRGALALQVGSGVGGLVATLYHATPAAVGLSLFSAVAGMVAPRIAGAAPDTSKIMSNILAEPVTLAPGTCATRTVFSGIWKGAKSEKAEIAE